MKLCENSTLVADIGRGQAGAFHPLGHQIIITGRRKEDLDRTTDANPGTAPVSLNKTVSACALKTINSHSDPYQSLGLLNRIRKFLAGFATGAEGRSELATQLPGVKNSSWSSVNQPNGPWVYTVVPWED
jgi:hypothetical protein